MMVSKRLDNVSKTLILGQKTAFLTPKRAILAVRGLIKAHQAVEWAPTRKPKVSRVTLGCGEVMIPLSRIHWSPKIGCYMGVAKKNANFLAKNYPKLALVVTREPAVQRCKHKQVAFLVSSHSDTNKFFVTAQNN